VRVDETNPPEDRTTVLQSKLYQAAQREPARRFHALYDKLCLSYVLQSAWELVRRNDGAAGIDQQTLAAFQTELHAQTQADLDRRVGANGFNALDPRERDVAGHVRQVLLRIGDHVLRRNVIPHARTCTAGHRRNALARNRRDAVDDDLALRLRRDVDRRARTPEMINTPLPIRRITGIARGPSRWYRPSAGRSQGARTAMRIRLRAVRAGAGRQRRAADQ